MSQFTHSSPQKSESSLTLGHASNMNLRLERSDTKFIPDVIKPKTGASVDSVTPEHLHHLHYSKLIEMGAEAKVSTSIICPAPVLCSTRIWFLAPSLCACPTSWPVPNTMPRPLLCFTLSRAPTPHYAPAHHYIPTPCCASLCPTLILYPTLSLCSTPSLCPIPSTCI